MICPLYKAGFLASPPAPIMEGANIPIDCDKEKCAWWLKGTSKCSILDIAESLDCIQHLEATK